MKRGPKKAVKGGRPCRKHRGMPLIGCPLCAQEQDGKIRKAIGG